MFTAHEPHTLSPRHVLSGMHEKFQKEPQNVNESESRFCFYIKKGNSNNYLEMFNFLKGSYHLQMQDMQFKKIYIICAQSPRNYKRSAEINWKLIIFLEGIANFYNCVDSSFSIHTILKSELLFLLCWKIFAMY